MADTFNKLEQDSLSVASETGYRKNTSFRIGNLFYRILQFIKNLFGGTFLLGDKANAIEIRAISDPQKGDTWRAVDTGHYWCYDGTNWNDLGNILPSDAIRSRDLGLYRSWLLHKEMNYSTQELTAINRILNIKIFVRNIVNTDVYTLNILKKKSESIYDLQIFRNGAFLYNIDLDASKDYAERKAIIEVNYNLSVEGSDLNALESQIVISPTCLATLEEFFLSRSYQMIDIERNNVGNIVSASVKWNDGVMGVYTSTDYNKKWMCYDGYTVSYDASAKYIRQQKVTRNNIGAIIKQPAIDIV